MSKTPRTDNAIITDNEYLMENVGLVEFTKASFSHQLEVELADMARALEIQSGVLENTIAENTQLTARIEYLDSVIDGINGELAELCPEGQTVIELLAKKDKLIERMKNCQNCGRTGGFCRHCRYAPDKRGWDDNWKEPI